MYAMHSALANDIFFLFLTLTAIFAITLIFLKTLRTMAIRFNLLDLPGGHKAHEYPTPPVGGLGLYLTIVFAELLFPGFAPEHAILLATAALVVVVGALDDAFNISATYRLMAHSVAALGMIVLGGVTLTSLGDILFVGPVQLGILSVPFTIVATAGVINATNMVDGADGLAGGLTLIALSLIAIVAFGAGDSPFLEFVLVVIVGVVAFLIFNYRLPTGKVASIFLGDAGSTLLGFILVWLFIEMTQGPDAIMAPVYALWFFAIPLMDTLTLTRLMRGVSPLASGRDHIHHRLIDNGYSIHQAVLIMLWAAMVCGFIGLAGFVSGAHEGLMFVGFVALLVLNFRTSVNSVARRQPKLSDGSDENFQ